MSDDTEVQDFASEQTSSSDSDSDEDPYESEDNHPYDFYSGPSPLYPYVQKTNQIVYEFHSGRKVARLREPRDLYGVSSNSFFHLPRWPYECQVIKKKIEHIGWKESYFMCSRVGGNCSPLKPVSLHSCEESDNTLVFESRFESGNLQKVVQVGDYDYQLTLRSDLYTDRHTQWYYFQVKNTRVGVPYRFTIVNLMKPTSLYSHGMRPLMYSEMDANAHHIGWKRIGDEIKYYKNIWTGEGQAHYSLSWTFRFPHSRDTCYFAHCYPYTYSNLQDYLSGVANDPDRSRYCKIRVLCHSLAGNIVYILTITNPSLTTEERKKKKAVILTARVHPGETNSSWMMKGFLDYILSSRSDAQLLRDTYVFKVVPMLNPDGVIVGNYRCSLSGRDLNRNYKSRLKDSFPSIWFTRNMIRRVMDEREILLYCDLHGHSRKQNVFMYGCKGGGAQNGSESHLCERIFPLMLSKLSPDKFSFSACKFKVQRNKEGTGRVVMWKMGIRNSYTLEATFCGSSMGKRRGTHFSTKDLESLGYHFCDALLDYCDPDQTEYLSCMSELEEMVKQRVNCNHRLVLDSESVLEDVLSDLDSSTRGSDSSDWNGPPAHLMELAGKVKPRRKLLKSKRERNSQRRPPARVPDPQEEDEGEKSKAMIVERQRWPIPEASKLDSVRKLQNCQKVSKKNRLTKQQRAPHFQDLSTKKVSVIYLVFNAKGEVITTKSLSGARNQDVVNVTSTFNSFNWKRPLPIFKNLFSQRVPLNNILEPCCYYVSPDINDSFRPNTANYEDEDGSRDGAQESVKMSFPSPVYEPRSLCYSKKFWSGELPVEKDMKRPALPSHVRAIESAPPAVSAAALKTQDQSGNVVKHKSKKTGDVSSAPRDQRGGGQKRENEDHLRHEKEETLLPAVTASREVPPPMGPDILYTSAAIRGGSVQNILPKMTSHPHTSHKSSASTRSLLPAKVRGRSLHSSKGAIQKRKLGKLIAPQPPDDCVTTDHANLPANTWKDILMGLQMGEGGGSGDRPGPAPSKGHLLKNGTSNGLGGCTRKSGQRVCLVPLPKTVPSSQ
ncbi:cytosolic carboxypeptidase 3 isoform X2 [Phyllobates terribilis]|uniref:cytosolic carboxypeptidase 3 isoform X2 n=1 Tax=Phyllobates terribilis TaxID=111132 RepID=UPI003CCACFFA